MKQRYGGYVVLMVGLDKNGVLGTSPLNMMTEFQQAVKHQTGM
jgi:hypothetical protein